jgi:hypothetical protein
MPLAALSVGCLLQYSFLPASLPKTLSEKCTFGLDHCLGKTVNNDFPLPKGTVVP